MYNSIVNPNTNRKVLINSRLGKKILNKYLSLAFGGENTSLTDSINVSDVHKPRDVQISTEGTEKELDNNFYIFNPIDKKKELILNLGGCCDFGMIDPQIYEKYNIVCATLDCTTTADICKNFDDYPESSSAPRHEDLCKRWHECKSNYKINCDKLSYKRLDVQGNALEESFWIDIKNFIKDKYDRETIDIVQFPKAASRFFVLENENFIYQKITDILTEKGVLYFDLYTIPPEFEPSPAGISNILMGKSTLSKYFEDADDHETYDKYLLSNNISMEIGITRYINRCIHKPIFWKDTPLGLNYIYKSEINVPYDITDLYLKLKKKISV